MPSGVEVVEQTVSLELAEPPGGTGTLDGLSVVVSPRGEVVDRATVPLKLLTLTTVMVEVPQEPGETVRPVGFALREKFGPDDDCTTVNARVEL